MPQPPQGPESPCLSEQIRDDMLMDLVAKMNQVLSHLAELKIGQGSTQNTLAELSSSIGRSGVTKHVSVVGTQNSMGKVLSISSSGGGDTASRGLGHEASETMTQQLTSVLEKTVSVASTQGTRRSAPTSPAGRLMRMGAAHLQRGIEIVEDIAEDTQIDQAEVDITVDNLMGLGICSTEATGDRGRGRRGWIVEPHCRARTVHDILSIVVLAVDFIWGLTALAWALNAEGVMFVYSIVSLAFWNLDIVITFCTGIYVDGELVLEPRKVAKSYLSSWFAVDVAIITTDIASLLLSEVGTQGRNTYLLRLSKASRFLRLLRVVRLARKSDAIVRLMESSPYFETLIETVKAILIILVLNHVLACAWWSVGSYLPSDTGFRWIHERVSPLEEMSFIEGSFWLQYWTCMHWSLTQLSVGTMDVAPRNALERAFNCFSLVLGMLVFSTLISAISAMMMKHYLKQKTQLTQFAALRRFLRSRVKPITALTAQFQAQRSMFGNTGKPITLDELDALALIPHALQRDIRVELCENCIKHPLFRWLFIIDNKGAYAFCQHAIKFKGLAAEDNLFFPRTDAIGAYAMMSGDGNYTLERERGLGLERSDKRIAQGYFLCEIALWCIWRHVGEFTATTACEVLVIHASGMIKCLEQVMVVRHVMVQYGRIFVGRVKEALLSDAEEDVDDLSVPYTDFASILMSLPAECQLLIGAVAALVKRGQLKYGTIQEVRDRVSAEVRDGMSCLMLNWEGRVERIVSIILLRVSHPDDGRHLIRLGLLNDDGFQATCDLPGCKQKGGETTDQAFARYLRGVFVTMAPHISFNGTEMEEAWKESKRMRMKTKYLKTVKIGHIDCPVENLDLGITQVTWANAAGERRRSRLGELASEGVSRLSRLSAHGAPTVMSRAFSGGSLGNMAPTESIKIDEDMQIYALADEAGEITFVSWLTPEEKGRLSTNEGLLALRRLMEVLLITPELIDAARERFQAARNAHQEGMNSSNSSLQQVDEQPRESSSQLTATPPATRARFGAVRNAHQDDRQSLS